MDHTQNVEIKSARLAPITAPLLPAEVDAESDPKLRDSQKNSSCNMHDILSVPMTFINMKNPRPLSVEIFETDHSDP